MLGGRGQEGVKFLFICNALVKQNFMTWLFFFFFPYFFFPPSSDYTLAHSNGANAFVSQERALPDTDMFNISRGLPNTSGMWTSLCFLIMLNNEMWK